MYVLIMQLQRAMVFGPLKIATFTRISVVIRAITGVWVHGPSMQPACWMVVCSAYSCRLQLIWHREALEMVIWKDTEHWTHRNGRGLVQSQDAGITGRQENRGILQQWHAGLTGTQGYWYV